MEFICDFLYASSQDRASSKLAFIEQRESKYLGNYVSCFHQEVLRTYAFGY